MTVRSILRYPDPRLRLRAEPVDVFDAALEGLVQDLLDTLRAAPGIGITAPHIGVPRRIVVLELQPGTPVRTYVNPSLVWASDERVRGPEGSISMPGISEDIERAARVRVSYQDIAGKSHLEEASGLLAICHQHEIDQLDGLFWIFRLSRLKRERVLKRFGKGHG